jgi:hypothetical protein
MRCSSSNDRGAREAATELIDEGRRNREIAQVLGVDESHRN